MLEKNNEPIGRFMYKSSEMHKDILNGKHQAHMNIIEIKNGEGKKTVVDILPSGKKRKTVKKLNKKEVESIRRRQFVPDLFKGMLFNLRNAVGELGAAPARKTIKKKKGRKQ
jgi:hypothetical protein